MRCSNAACDINYTEEIPLTPCWEQELERYSRKTYAPDYLGRTLYRIPPGNCLHCEKYIVSKEDHKILIINTHCPDCQTINVIGQFGLAVSIPKN
jgi:hypothetical protein